MKVATIARRLVTLSAMCAVFGWSATPALAVPFAGLETYGPLLVNGSLTVAAPGVLANDGDPNPSNLPLVAQLMLPPAHGVISGPFGSGGFTYTPAAFFYGSDSFTYIAVNQIGQTSAPATVLLTILDHADAEFDGGSGNTLSLNFGMLASNSGSHSLQYRVGNTLGPRVALTLDALAELGDDANPSSGAFSTGATITNLATGAFSSFFDVFFDTTALAPGPYSAHYQFHLHDAHQYDQVGGTPQQLDLFVTAEIAQVPEPGTGMLAAVGLMCVCLAAALRRR
jgi:hypothetical protein